jgi:chromosome segregation ATPase
MPQRNTALLEDPEPNVLRFEPHTDDDFHRPVDNVDEKFRAAQERLARLRREQEEVEREQRHLEELHHKKERFAEGKRDLTEKLARATSSLERELYDLEKLVQEVAINRDTFARHLDILRGLQPEHWDADQVDSELDNALAAIDDAAEDFAKGMRRVAACRPTSLQDSQPAGSSPAMRGAANTASRMITEDPDLRTWARRGFAFTLPLMATLVICLVIARLIF